MHYVDPSETIQHGASYNLTKVLNFSSPLEKSLNSVKVAGYLKITWLFIWSWKVLEFHYFVDATSFSVKVDFFAREQFGSSSV